MDNDGKNNKVETFLRTVRGIYSSLPKKAQSAIDQFSTRIYFEKEKILEIKNMKSENLDILNIEDEALLDDIWKTTGTLNLKIASDFEPSDYQINSMEDKFGQYIRVQNEVYFYNKY